LFSTYIQSGLIVLAGREQGALPVARRPRSREAEGMSDPTADAKIVVRRDDAVLTITFNRPHKKNAFDAETFAAFAQALRDADADADARVILLEGAGENFTAGADIAVFKPGGADLEHALALLQQLVAQEKPIIAAVDGAAVGIGTTLLLHTDYVAASTRARFHLPFTNYGLAPEGGSTLLLPLLVGMQRASEWLLFGEPFDVDAARDAGLVNAVVPPDQLHAFALARAQALAARPAGAVRTARRLLRQRLRAELQKTILDEGEHFIASLSAPETQAALLAFVTRKR
jgi:enoyl-CoA hydratase/carnithine racemase